MAYIGLEGLAARIPGGIKERRGDEYLFLCPCHDDHKPSLWVRETDKGLLMKCRANCPNELICQSIGIDVRDLSRGSQASGGRQSWQKRENRGSSKKPKSMELYNSYEAAYGRIGKVVKVYPYTDGQGKLLFEVARIQLPDGDKTFRQHRPANPQRGKFPIVKNVPHDLAAGAIYRLPEVEKGIADGCTVYVVEGEKDVDTLFNMGLIGVTCPMGAEKWTEGHSERLRGADVVIIPDNDDPGEKHGQKIIELTVGTAKRVRLVHLVDGYPQLGEKGDITDLVEAVGMDRAKEILLELAGKATPIALELYEVATAAFNRVPGYCVDHGCICQKTEDATKTLGTFVALPVREITRDDGMETIHQLEIAGWNAAGHALPRVFVDMEKFGSMSWAPNNWGLAANIMPGTTVKDKLRAVITAAGAQVAEQHLIYGHTGWRRIGGKWAYLYNGGCIGAENVEVQTDEKKLSGYGFNDVPADLDAADAAYASYALSSLVKWSVSVPLLGCMYLAPLREFLRQGGVTPAFLLMLKGNSLTHKSTVMGLFLSHFGQFGYDQLTASFHDTANAIRRQAFILKDMPLVVDDYHPTASLQERRKMEGIAQELSRTFGDNASRNRMGADLKLQRAMPVRSLALITGEQIPDIGESGMNRLYIIEVQDGDIPFTKDFDAAQQEARIGTLRAAMKGYIEWLLPQADGLSTELRDMFAEYRGKARDALAATGARKGYDRAAPAIAHIMIGLTMMYRYMVHLGLMGAEEGAGWLDKWWDVVVGNSMAQMEKSVDERPLSMYLTAVKEMVAARAVTVINLLENDEGLPARADRAVVGYMDKDYYYFLAGTLWGAVSKYYQDQNRVIASNQMEIQRMLREEGIVTIGGDGKTTRAKRIGSRVMRLLWIPRVKIDGPRAEADHQLNFKEIDDDDLPFKKEDE